MKRPHRRVHRLVWTALPLLLLALLAVSLAVRQPPLHEDRVSAP